MTPRRATGGVAVLAAVMALALSACGSDDKPAYCSDVDNFKESFAGLSTLSISKDAISQLRTTAEKVKATGDQLVSSTKSEFPQESAALSTSVTALAATVQEVGNSSTQGAALRALPAEVLAVKSAYDNLSNAVKDKCD